MSLAAAIAYIRGLLDGVAMPFPSTDPVLLAAYITPPDPNVESHIPTLYVIDATGPEKRLTVPRNTGPGTPSGEKTAEHKLRLHIIWFLAGTSPAAPGAQDPDLLFSGVIGTVMAALRTSPSPQVITDPWTGEETELADTGENMTYTYYPRHATKNQRMLRYDGVIDLPLTELITA